MPDPDIGTPTAASTAGNVIQSIRTQIPDPVADPASDGTAFTLATLVRWINDGMRVMATRAPIVQDWYALQSQAGQMTYVLPGVIITVEQLWYDLFPCARAAELDNLYSSKITARSYYFGPHSVHAVPRLHLFPACERTGQTTTVSTSIDDDDTSLVVAAVTTFQTYGYFTVENEMVKYETTTTATNTFSNLLRGQGGTVAASHNAGATVTENNIFFKCSRLPVAIAGVSDVIEIPLGLVPLLELYVLSKVRNAEQEFQIALAMSQEFDKQMDRLSSAYSPRGVRQGLQVRSEPPGPVLWMGRVVIP